MFNHHANLHGAKTVVLPIIFPFSIGYLPFARSYLKTIQHNIAQMEKKWITTLFFLISVSLSASPRTQWTYQTGGQVIGTCALSESSLFVGSTDGYLYALDKQSGALQWKFDGKNEIRSTPAIDETTVFFHTVAGDLYALDTHTGGLQWQTSLKGETMVDVWDYYQSSPVIHHNLLIVGSGNGQVYGLNKETGKEVWTFRTGGVVHTDPLVYDDKVYIGSFDGHLYALDSATGTALWSFKTVGNRYFPQGAIQNAPTLFEGMILFGSRDFNLYAINAQTGTGTWNWMEPGSWVIATPTISATDSLLFVGTSDSHAFYCTSAWDGSIKWKINLNMRVYGKEVLYKDDVLFGCFNGILYAANQQTGNITWTFQTENSLKNHSIVYNEDGSFNEALFTITNMEELLKSENAILNLGSFLASPIVENDKVYIGSTDGNVYALTID